MLFYRNYIIIYLVFNTMSSNRVHYYIKNIVQNSKLNKENFVKNKKLYNNSLVKNKNNHNLIFKRNFGTITTITTIITIIGVLLH